MKLYFAPGACSLGIHVILEEIGKPYEAQAVNLREGEHFKPAFTAINPKSKVPVLVLDDGKILTEWLAIASYLAAINPAAKLVPEDKFAWARATEMMAYVTGVMHGQGFARMFRPERFTPNPDDHEAVRTEGRRIFAEGFAVMSEALGEQDYLLGHVSIADAALFYVSFWGEARQKLVLPPRIAAHYARMKSRPAVQRAMVAEGVA
ncbi:MAG: glutathione S-transferase N-terminal domain-containing protein [Acidiphilium sp.]|nr:glutathione S-transferase N-terminal domain-containing protein [Acidiphilium sp.]MDD4934693.1 glutathione S-transferase N-terminal domain-containing protein [Acidiphilium sp.]